VDGQPYGPRVPLLAIGPFARKGTISHTTMEHSSIVKFIEWNWLGGTGQLGARDATVNNLGSMLDPSATGVTVPAN
jgi:phospholipase C